MPDKPVILAVDDDPEVLRAVARDLRQAYAADYRVLRAESGTQALDAIRQIKLENDELALMVVDQRMPQMSGVELLEQAAPIFPDAKRVLLTAYADTDAAIRAINRVRLDYYLMKPWHPPEQQLYPVLDDLLEDWKAGFRPGRDAIRIVDHRWSPLSHQLKDFLARNHVPYVWLDVEDAAAAELLATLPQPEAQRCRAGCENQLPLVVLTDGTRLMKPDVASLADRLGLSTHATTPFYDLLIVGAGPGGLAAAVYGASEGLRCAMIEREAPGGQAGTSSRIENYLGFPSGLSGSELARRALTQARRFGAELILTREVTGLGVSDDYKTVRLSDASEITCHALVVASGVDYRRLDVPGIDALTGRGVFYGAATTEAVMCSGQDVFVVGGGNSAGQGAMFLSRFARKVTILCRGAGLAATMSQYLIDQIGATPNIEVRPRTVVCAVEGDGSLERVTLRDVASGGDETLPAGALFIYIGAEPLTDWLGACVRRDDRGYILTGVDLMNGSARPDGWPLDRDPFLLETSVPGIFAVGDVRANSVKRVAAAVGEGSTAVQFVHRYLADR